MEEIKKSDRKKKRFAARLKNSKGITVTDKEGTSIVLCNVGQATGYDINNVQKLITEYNLPIECPKYISVKGESHSFLVFDSIEAASVFYNTINTNRSGPPLYMSYVENVPNTKIICPHPDPVGLTILKDFITSEEEQLFINLFHWTSDIDSNSLKNRQVKHYGYEFRYSSNDVDLDSPLSEKIPATCNVLWQRLSEQGYSFGVPDQLTVNKYSPGQGIPVHVDRHSPFAGTILSLSLGSAVVMDWRHPSGKYVPIHVPARSMLIMQDEARYDWQHGIQPRAFDPIIKHRQSDNGTIKVITNDTIPRGTRISLTFRWTRHGPCQCRYKTLCDSVQSNADDMDDKMAASIEEMHVHQVYDQIANHFSSTRHSAWPAVVEFLQRAPLGARVLDLGAGNGKNILPRTDILQIACERSEGLLSQMRAGTLRVRLDLLQCALIDDCADRLICIAVLHHFITQARRLQALSHIYRVVAPTGRALITVWAKDQSRSNYLLKNKHTTNNLQIDVGGVSLPVHENRTQFQHNDLLVPWKLKGKNVDESTLLRFYHVFEEGELDELCRRVGFVVERSFYEEGNWCVECKKCE